MKKGKEKINENKVKKYSFNNNFAPSCADRLRFVSVIGVGKDGR